MFYCQSSLKASCTQAEREPIEHRPFELRSKIQTQDLSQAMHERCKTIGGK